MVPKGLAAAVLVQIPLQAGIPRAEQLLTPVFATIFFTIAFTTLLIFLVEHNRYPGTSALLKSLLARARQSKYSVKLHKGAAAEAGMPAKNAKAPNARAAGKRSRKAGKKMQAKAKGKA